MNPIASNVAGQSSRWIRVKGRVPGSAWAALTVATTAAIGLTVAKLAGWSWLAGACSLAHLPVSTQGRLGHLFVVPIGALVVAILRLTLDLRTLGPFRSILLAMAFASVGFAHGLALFLVVTALVMALRPFTRRLGLPYYARVLTILSAVACMVVAILIVASATGAADLTKAAAFPIVVLALTGDTSSRVLAREGWRSLATRFAITLGAAILIALIAESPYVRATLIAYPELMVLQVVAIVIVSEAFDVRLFGGKSPRHKKGHRGGGARHARPLPARELSGKELSNAPLRVAVVRNRSRRGVLGRLGRRAPGASSRKTIQRVLDALRAAGLEARAFEGDGTLVTSLAEYLPIDRETRRVRGVVLNLAGGIQGEHPTAHVPAMLELAGIPYTGASPGGHVIASDIAAMRQSLRTAGIATPCFRVVRDRADGIGDLEFPLVVRPRDAGASRLPRVVSDQRELEQALSAVLERSRCDAIVESHVVGRRFSIVVVGDSAPHTLPITEFASRSESAGELAAGARKRRVCPAKLDVDVELRLRTTAVAACRACGVRDLSRVDLRIDRAGEIVVSQVHAMPALGWAGITVRSAKRGGYDFAALLFHVVTSAAHRAGLVVAAAPVEEGLR